MNTYTMPIPEHRRQTVFLLRYRYYPQIWILIVLYQLLSPSILEAQCNELIGQTGNVDFMAVASDTVYTFGDSAISISTDQGSTWRRHHVAFPNNSMVTAFTGIGKDLVLATSTVDSCSIFKADSRTSAWQMAPCRWIDQNALPTTRPRVIFSLLVAPSFMDAGTDIGLFFTTDKGTTWLQCSGIERSDTARVFKIVKAGGSYFCTNGVAIFKVGPNQRFWTLRARSKSLPSRILDLNVVNDTIIITCGDGSVYSLSSKLLWMNYLGSIVRTGSQGNNALIEIFAHKGALLAYGSLVGLFRSYDGGRRWAQLAVIGKGAPGSIPSMSSVAVSSNYIFGITDSYEGRASRCRIPDVPQR